MPLHLYTDVQEDPVASFPAGPSTPPSKAGSPTPGRAAPRRHDDSPRAARGAKPAADPDAKNGIWPIKFPIEIGGIKIERRHVFLAAAGAAGVTALGLGVASAAAAVGVARVNKRRSDMASLRRELEEEELRTKIEAARFEVRTWFFFAFPKILSRGRSIGWLGGLLVPFQRLC